MAWNFTYGKFQLLGARCNPDIRLRKHGNELSRRIGIAKSDFAALQKVWKHSSLHYRQKSANLQNCG
jgi:hypothetical protein